MKRFSIQPLIQPWVGLCCGSLLAISIPTHVFASGFQLWEQDGASVGNYHAGYAAEANDASIAWYNPAGITRFHNQEIVIAASAIVTDFKYKGNVGVTETSFTSDGEIGPVTFTFNSVTAQGGTFNLVPALQYVAPINDRIGFGFSVGVPFGLKTDYGNSTPLRYAATLTSITIIDISPSLGFKISDNASLGVGFDIQRASAEFNNTAAIISPFDQEVITSFDSDSVNRASDTGYGFHAGLLYEINAGTRVGLSYHSQVVHHFSGSSRFSGPIADEFNDDNPVVSGNAKTNVTLPPYTALSVFHQFNPCWAVMGSIIWTQWNSFKKLIFSNAAGLDNSEPDGFPPEPSNTIEVEVPENYHNTINLSLGVNYYPTDSIILRGGIGYDQTPVPDSDRNVRLPDSNRYAIAMGAHFQATRCLGFDIGWSHIFANKNTVNPPPQPIGAETVTTQGHVRGGADVLSGQVVWDIV